MNTIKHLQPDVNTPQQFISNIYCLTRRQRLALNSFIDLSVRYRTVYPSQRLISKKACFCLRHVNRLLNNDLLRFVTHQRRYNTTCTYTVHHLFKSPAIALALCHLLPALVYLTGSTFLKTHTTINKNVLSSLNGCYLSRNQSQYIESNFTNRADTDTEKLIDFKKIEELEMSSSPPKPIGEIPSPNDSLLHEISSKLNFGSADTAALKNYPSAILSLALSKTTSVPNIRNIPAYFFTTVRKLLAQYGSNPPQPKPTKDIEEQKAIETKSLARYNSGDVNVIKTQDGSITIRRYPVATFSPPPPPETVLSVHERMSNRSTNIDILEAQCTHLPKGSIPMIALAAEKRDQERDMVLLQKLMEQENNEPRSITDRYS
jgi:hypothetical protein